MWAAHTASVLLQTFASVSIFLESFRLKIYLLINESVNFRRIWLLQLTFNFILFPKSGNPSYNWDSENAECVPVCDGECPNGKCIAPEKCECNDGFVHHPTESICTPNCSEPCVNGDCVATNKCECDLGHQFANGSQSICEPICEMSCKNAKCIEPNVCACTNGFLVADDSKPHECHCGLYCVEVDGYCHCLDEEHRVSGERIRRNISSICSESNCVNGFCMTPYDCECKGVEIFCATSAIFQII